jgi:hypothetical protein
MERERMDGARADGWSESRRMERERMDGARTCAYSSRMLECSFESVCGRQGGRGLGVSVDSFKFFWCLRKNR